MKPKTNKERTAEYVFLSFRTLEKLKMTSPLTDWISKDRIGRLLCGMEPHACLPLTKWGRHEKIPWYLAKYAHEGDIPPIPILLK